MTGLVLRITDPGDSRAESGCVAGQRGLQGDEQGSHLPEDGPGLGPQPQRRQPIHSSQSIGRRRGHFGVVRCRTAS